MSLGVGARLGHYTVTAKLGEGGMGEVWQATDTTLNRQVALKILPEAFAADPDRLARFQREAQVLASLNHPNIAQIYGIEEAEDTRALVLELVEGPTLADRIGKGPIPVDEALPIAKQIAEALEAAHEAGVIHRRVRPACQGEAHYFRFADDFLACFQYNEEADRFRLQLEDRLEGFGLTLAADKTQRLEFGRFARENAYTRGGGLRQGETPHQPEEAGAERAAIHGLGAPGALRVAERGDVPAGPRPRGRPLVLLRHHG